MIINTNKAKAIKCDCAICGWAKKAYGHIYCNYYKQNDPAKDKCNRYYAREYKPTKGEYKKTRTQ